MRDNPTTVIKIGQDSWSVDAEGYALKFNKETGAFERVRCGESETLLRVDEDGPHCPTCGGYPSAEDET